MMDELNILIIANECVRYSVCAFITQSECVPKQDTGPHKDGLLLSQLKKIRLKIN